MRPDPLRDALEAAIVENPDDLAAHSAYADYLTEQNDPRGEFVAVQLALEDESRSPEEREDLRWRELVLLDEHQDAWLGGLAPLLTGPPDPAIPEWQRPEYEFAFSRGRLSSLKVGRYSLAFTRALAAAPEARLLRSLALVANVYEDPTPVLPGDGVPDDLPENPQLYPLASSTNLTNVRTFVLGEAISEEEDETDVMNIHNNRCDAEGVAGVVARMPRLEELRLFARPIDLDRLFSLRTLHRLRVLKVYHADDYPLGRLAENDSLENLTHLLLHPHSDYGGPEDDPAGGGFLRLPAVRPLFESGCLPSLTHLRLRGSDIGDEGVAALVASGRLKTLRYLDLRHGRVSDEGARLLAACPDARNLEVLDLVNNRLSPAGVAALTTLGIRVLRTDHQRDGDEYPSEYLGRGDME